jgi:hypothetical protein
MQTVIIGHNALDPATWVKHETNDVRELIVNQFATWPEHARIYHGQVALDRDVTPHNETEVERLATLDDIIFVVNYPGTPLVAIIAIVAVIAVAAVAFLFMPTVPSLKNSQAASPNNALADRTNSPRPNGRIPDIFGTVRSTPDLLAVPYKIFKNNKEVEVAFMCVGKGHYEIDDILDDTTPVETIAGTSVAIYGPFTSPRSGDAPIVQIGAEITEPLINAKKFNSVNGQVLEPTNGSSSYNVPCAFHYPNRLIAQPSTVNQGGTNYNGKDVDNEIATDLTKYFNVGDIINVSAAPVDNLNLSGQYVIQTISATEIVFSDTSANKDWQSISSSTNNETDYVDTLLTSSGSGWVGSFVLDPEDLSMVLANFVALNGLYKDDGKNKFAINVDCQLELTPIDSNSAAKGPAELFTVTVYGDANSQSTRAATMYAQPTFTGPCRVRGRRLTPKDTNFKGTVVDEVKWRDVYAVSPVEQNDFGNVTTVFALTYGTEGALAVKDRKLNMLVKRKLPYRLKDNVFSDSFGEVKDPSNLVGTNSAADIAMAMALDPYIGNRTIDEMNVNSIYETIEAIKTYFNVEAASEFCYTFDKDNISFEETLSSLASAVFCIAYRRGRVINFFFERKTEDSTLLFNHRNKLPNTETRTVTFGRANDYDGIEYQYAGASDGAPLTYYIPEDRSAVNPKKIESIGHANKFQAYLAAWRAYNKIVYQNCTTEFDATGEADMLVVQERILIADNTRPDTQDGQIEVQAGLLLGLSQPFKPIANIDYTIFVQHIDGSIETIPIKPSADPYAVVLQRAPRAALSTDDANFAKATYQIVGNNQARNSAFLVSEKSSKSNGTVTLKAINYDKRYYGNDFQFVPLLATEDGPVISTEDGQGIVTE